MKGSRNHCLWLGACCLIIVLNGCSWLVPDEPPVAVISANPATGRAPLDVHLSGALSEDDAGILSYSWEFPDQDTDRSSGIQTDQHFSQSGDYIVHLTVTDSAGQSATAEATIQVVNTPPIASCRFSNDAPIPGESVLFDASSSVDPDGTLIDFIWDFGDGTSQRGTRLSHTYEQLGQYEVQLIVVDNAGASSTISHTMTVHTQSVSGGCGG